MARPLRVEYPEALYHVTARGNDRRPIFVGKRGYEHFLELLTAGIKEYDVLLHAYVLMKNHYHLVVRTMNPNLSRFMHFLNTSLTVWSNRKYRRTGHLLEGRYKAILMQEEGYLLRVAGYVHLNPVRVKAWKNRPAEERFEHLKEYPWSSYQEYAVAGKKPREPFVSCQNVYGKLGACTDKEGRRYFREYITGWLEKEEEDRLAGKEVRPEDDEYDNPFSEVRLQALLGGDEFRDALMGVLDGEEELSSDIVGHGDWEERPSAEEVLSRAADLLGLSREALVKRSRGNQERGIVMYLCKDISKCSLREVGALFGVTPAAVSLRLKELREAMDSDKALRKRVKKTREGLS